MKDIAIYGAGGFGREVACLLRRINEQAPKWNLIGFFDDDITTIAFNKFSRGKIPDDVCALTNRQSCNSVFRPDPILVHKDPLVNGAIGPGELNQSPLIIGSQSL